MAIEPEGPIEGPLALEDIVRRAEVHFTTVGEMVYAVIRHAILGGVFEPGQHLRQDALAEVIGVSRMPVRSALMQLESEGLVSFHPHRGAVVRELSPDQIREIYDVRVLLETHALRHAISSMTPDRIARLEELAAALDTEEDGDRFLQLRLAFYRELYDADRHPLLMSLIERLRGDVGRYWLRRRVVDGHEPGHTDLLRYARVRDAEGAVRWLRNHLERVTNELVALIQRGRDGRSAPAVSVPNGVEGSQAKASTGARPDDVAAVAAPRDGVRRAAGRSHR